MVAQLPFGQPKSRCVQQQSGNKCAACDLLPIAAVTLERHDRFGGTFVAKRTARAAAGEGCSYSHHRSASFIEPYRIDLTVSAFSPRTLFSPNALRPVSLYKWSGSVNLRRGKSTANVEAYPSLRKKGKSSLRFGGGKSWTGAGRLHTCVNRQQPFGPKGWQPTIVAALGIESMLRRRGRPLKVSEK